MAKESLLMGAHISIAGGFYKAIIRGQEIGATAIQIFTKNNRQWYAKKITKEDIEKFITQQKQSSIRTVVAHASYLINLGSQTKSIIEKSITALADELERCEMLSIPYLVVHPGTQHYENLEDSLKFTAHNINQAIKKSKTKRVMLLLETMAGQGSTIGNTFQELATLIHNIADNNRVGICMDTCHIFAAGYNLDTAQNYKALFHDFNKIIGLNKLKLFHINDSKKNIGSRVDRHEHIGKGFIDSNAFTLLIKDKRFKKIPKILETPKQNGLEGDKKNLEMLRKYYHK